MHSFKPRLLSIIILCAATNAFSKPPSNAQQPHTSMHDQQPDRIWILNRFAQVVTGQETHTPPLPNNIIVTRIIRMHQSNNSNHQNISDGIR